MNNKNLFILGNGIRNNPKLIEYLKSLYVPILTTWASLDIIEEDHPSFCGRFGLIGQRAANILIQKADKIYIFGARLDDDSIVYRLDNFGKNAIKHVYDIDQAELDKLPNTNDWIKIKCNLSNYTIDFNFLEINKNWYQWSKNLYNRFRPELDGKENKKFVDVGSFVNLISNLCEENEIICLGSSSTAPVSFLQAFKVKSGQRIIGCSTIGSMGIGLPMSIGASLANKNKRIIHPCGDGDWLMQVQELEVVRRLNLPIKFFVYNNNGYSAIRGMQNSRFNGRHVGSDEQSGLTLTSIKKIADCYDIDYAKIHTLNDYTTKCIKYHLSTNNPSIIELNIDPNHQQYPKVMSSLQNGVFINDSLENMTPKLEPEVLKRIMEE